MRHYSLVGEWAGEAEALNWVENVLGEFLQVAVGKGVGEFGSAAKCST